MQKNSPPIVLPFSSQHLEVAHAAATAAGEILKKHFTKHAEHGQNISLDNTDKQSWDLLTVADVEAEKAIISMIKQTFPDHDYLAEESANDASDESHHDHLWIIDPLDGTNNFAHGIPHFAVSIAYYENSKPVLGVIHNPISNDWYVAGQGRGAWHNSVQAHVSQHQQLSQTMVGVGFYYDRGEMMLATLAAVNELFEQQIHGIRRMGTAALDLVHVGLGRFGGYFEYKLSPWDFAAGILFVEEAGGKVTDCSGESLPLAKSTILATNTLLHDDILQIVKRHQID